VAISCCIYGSLALLALYPLRHVGARYLVGIGLALSLAGGTLGIANAMGLGAAVPAAALQEGGATARAAHTTPTAAQEQAIDAAVALRDRGTAGDTQGGDGRSSGYLASEPDNAKGEADFVALVFRTGWVFEILAS